MKLCDINPGRELMTVLAHAEPIYDIAYSPDGSRVATIGFEGEAKLWDPASGLLVRSLTPENVSSGLTGVAFHPDGGQITLGGWDAALYVLAMENDEPALVLSEHLAPVLGVAYSPDGRCLATVSWDGTGKVWDSSAGKSLMTLKGGDDVSGSVAFSGVAFSPDGTRVYTAGDSGYTHEWDAATGEELQRFPSDGLDVHGVTVSPDGRTLAMGRQDGAVVLWDIASGKKLHQLSAHAGLVLRLAFSRDGSKLASVGFDSLAKVWDVASGQELMTLYGTTGNVFGAAFSPDGKYLATAGGDGTLRTYTLDMSELIALAHERVTRELTNEECRVYLHTETCPHAR